MEPVPSDELPFTFNGAEVMHEKREPKKKYDPRVLVSVDAFVICAPAMIYFFILFLEGDIDTLFARPEWSYITVFFLVEVLRDQIKRIRLEGHAEEAVESGVVFYGIILVLGALVLIADFKNSLGLSQLPEPALLFTKFGFLILATGLFWGHRARKYKAIQ